MHMEPAILLSIITERVMERTLKELVERAGAQGYTLEDVASGWGPHGSRTGPHKSDQNLKMLLLVSKPGYGVKFNRSCRDIDQASLERLIRHTWPGNVRELENVIERALIRSHEPVLRIDEYDSEAQGSSLEAAPSSNLKEFERRHILQTLTLAGWHIEGPDGAAARLGLPPSTLRSRMKLFGMKRPSAR